ncbi:50S ribosomal protein L6, partial [Candidatus Parcubacteria bacterium]|nr:50S ribosomal protein L6 [Candidatus Parcubacteria bacterium]
MSKIGRKPIEIPEKVKVEILNGKIIVEGPKGKLEKEIPSVLEIQKCNSQLKILPKNQERKTKALWGTFRQLIFNMIEGTTKGFEKKLQISGLGYKAKIEGDKLVLDVGFSHPVFVSFPPQVKVTVEKDIISVSGIDKELVGQIAAKIRAVKPADP